MLVPFHCRVILVLIAAAPAALGLLVLSRPGQERDDAQMRFQLAAKGSTIDVEVGPGDLVVSGEELKRWVQNAADAIVAYYGRFPVPHLELHLRVSERAGVHGGRTFPAPDGGR